jgi:hypothetical protein
LPSNAVALRQGLPRQVRLAPSDCAVDRSVRTRVRGGAGPCALERLLPGVAAFLVIQRCNSAQIGEERSVFFANSCAVSMRLICSINALAATGEKVTQHCASSPLTRKRASEAKRASSPVLREQPIVSGPSSSKKRRMPVQFGSIRSRGGAGGVRSQQSDRGNRIREIIVNSLFFSCDAVVNS